MRRYLPGILIVLFLLGLIGGIVWKTLEMQRCFDKGGVVIDSFGRHQRCVNPEGPLVRVES